MKGFLKNIVSFFRTWFYQLTHQRDISGNIQSILSKYQGKEIILQFIHQPVEVSFGGTELFTKYLYQNLKGYLHIVIYIGNGFTQLKFTSGNETEVLEIKNYVKRHTFQLKNIVTELHFNFILGLLNPDIIHFQNLSDMPISLIEVAQRKFKTIIHIHDFGLFYPPFWQLKLENKSIEDDIYSIIKQSEKAYYTKRLSIIKDLLRKASKVIAPSEYATNKVNEFVNSNYVVTIENAVDFIPSFNNPLNESKLRIGWLGTFVKHKGAVQFLELMRKDLNSEFEWVIAGKDSENLFNPDEFTYTNVKFLGQYNNVQRSRIISSMDIVLFPSQCAETYSLSMSEVLMMGKIIMVCDIGAIGDRAKKYGLSYIFERQNFVENTWESLAEIKSNRILLEREREKIMLININTIENMFDGIRGIYEKLLG